MSIYKPLVILCLAQSKLNHGFNRNACQTNIRIWTMQNYRIKSCSCSKQNSDTKEAKKHFTSVKFCKIIRHILINNNTCIWL